MCLPPCAGCSAYRIYTDLERGWRVTMPNLEQTGLLRFGYTDLDEIAADEESWAGHPSRASRRRRRSTVPSSPGSRWTRCAASLAVDADVLTADGFERTCSSCRTSSSPVPGRSRRTSRRVFARTVYGCSGRTWRQPGCGALYRAQRARPVPAPGREFPQRLRQAHHRRRAGDHRGPAAHAGTAGRSLIARRTVDGATGYRLKSSALIWRAGDGETAARRTRCARPSTPRSAPG